MLFRLVEPCAGTVLVGGIDIASIGLQTLRQQMAVIPQHPLLMDGTVRFNLDPFAVHSDAKLQDVLRLLELPARITLATELGGSGACGALGLSAGQRQLLTLGRTLLKEHVSILVMDEPTSNIDAKTDAHVQENLIRGRLHGVTVLTIAHRVETIVDSDRIVVMDAGRVVEIGSPRVLLGQLTSHFSRLVGEMGPDVEQRLRAAVA